MIGFIRFIYWKMRLKCCGIINYHFTFVEGVTWNDMTFSKKADLLKFVVLSANGKIQGEDITDKEL